jgi:hypothetical protein
MSTGAGFRQTRLSILSSVDDVVAEQRSSSLFLVILAMQIDDNVGNATLNDLRCYSCIVLSFDFA